MAEPRDIRRMFDLMPVIPLADGPYAPSLTNLPDPNIIVGVELEIENWRGGHGLNGFTYEIDGSLRNNGMEGITAPVKVMHLESMLTQFFTHHHVTEDNYSERCSTHVHMNVQDLGIKEVRSICLLYQIFERLLFRFVGHEREDNIFCVPWHTSGTTSAFVDKLSRSLDKVVGAWVKYTALNLLPMREKGTIEFRHLHGTCNVETIMQWVRFLCHMRVYAQKVDYKALTKTIMDMNTVSNYDMFMLDVFGDDAAALMAGDYKTALSVGVVDAKLMLMRPPKVERPAARPARATGERPATIGEFAAMYRTGNHYNADWLPTIERADADGRRIMDAEIEQALARAREAVERQNQRPGVVTPVLTGPGADTGEGRWRVVTDTELEEQAVDFEEDTEF